MATRTIVLIYLLGLIGLVAALQLEESQVGLIRQKRQSNQRPQDGAPMGVSATGSAQASTGSLVPALNTGGQLGLGNAQVGAANRPLRPKVTVGAAEPDADDELGLDDDERPIRVPKPKRKKKRPVNRRPVIEDDDEAADDDYEPCHDGEYDYGHGFQEAALGQMHHFGRMMHGMFGKMSGMAAADFDRLPKGANSAVASSSSNGGGYSRSSSMVTNNGRTRGIVSETRDGRTRTRRIGSDDEEDDE